MPLVLNGATSGSTTVQATDAVTATLTLPSSTGTLLSTANPQSGGVIQVVQSTYSTQTSTTSSSQTATGLSATITPKFSTSKILVIAMQAGLQNTGSVYSAMNLYLVKSATVLLSELGLGYSGNSLSTFQPGPVTLVYLDSPATTSPVSYSTLFCQQAGGAGSVVVQATSQTSTMTLLEIAA